MGNPIRQILLFAIPLFIGNIFQQVYNLVDIMIAGHGLGDSAIAAIGAGSSIYSLLINFSSGMNSGYGIIVARAFGAKINSKIKESIATMLLLNACTTFFLSALSLTLLPAILHAMNVPANIFADAQSYIRIIFLGLIATSLYNMFSGILRAVGNSRAPLCFLIIACVINISLDILFVIVLRLGVKGAAAATIISQGISAILSGLHLVKYYPELLPEKKHFKLNSPLLRELISTGLAVAAMLCVVDIGSVLYQRAINHLGETIIAAHTAARKLIGMMIMPLSSIATAYSTFVGQNYGAGKPDRIKTTLRHILLLETVFGFLSFIVIMLFGEHIVILITDSANHAVISNAVLSLRLHFVCFPALGILLPLRSAMQAMGQKIIPIISSVFELAIKILSGYMLIPMFGYRAACMTEPVIWLIGMSFLAAAYRKKARPTD